MRSCLIVVVLTILFAVPAEAAGKPKPRNREKMFPTKASIVKLLADTIYLEAGGETNEGKLGVASVIFNRAGSYLEAPRVILTKRQFSCWSNRNPLTYKPPCNDSYKYCKLVAKDIVDGTFVPPLKFRGVVSYHEQSINPRWAKEMSLSVKEDKHLFYTRRPLWMMN